MKMMIVLLLFAVVSVTMEKTPSQGVDKRDALNFVICHYLKVNGFLAKNANLRKLCFKTHRCNDILSKQSCKVVMANNDCTNVWKVNPKYCPFTCHLCGGPPCKVSVPLGMQSKAIPDSKITASTYYDNNYKTYYARLHMNSHGWATKVNRVGQWLQVDLSKVTTITGIATQGNKKGGHWVKSYWLQYSLNGSTFHKYQAGRIFAANVNHNSVVKHDLNPPIQARYIRLYPKTYHNHMVMRMELYGCK